MNSAHTDPYSTTLDVSHASESGEIESLSHGTLHSQQAQGSKVQPRQLGAQAGESESAGDSFASSGNRGVSLTDVQVCCSRLLYKELIPKPRADVVWKLAAVLRDLIS